MADGDVVVAGGDAIVVTAGGNAIVVTAGGDECRKTPGNDVLIAEYQAAQDSAHHHELLGWQSRSILWAASMLLFGYASASSLAPAVVSLLAFAGLCLLVFPLIWNARLGKIKKLKYDRCREIEELLGMQQHKRTARRFPEGHLAPLSYALVSLLALAWVARTLVAWLTVAWRMLRAVLAC